MAHRVGINPVRKREGVSIVVSPDEVFYDAQGTDHGDILRMTALHFQHPETLLRAEYRPEPVNRILVSYPNKASDLRARGDFRDQFIMLYDFLSDMYPDDFGVTTDVRMLGENDRVEALFELMRPPTPRRRPEQRPGVRVRSHSRRQTLKYR